MNGFSLASYGECLSTDVFRSMEFHQCLLQHRVPFAALVCKCVGYMHFKCQQKRKKKRVRKKKLHKERKRKCRNGKMKRMAINTEK